MIITGSINLPGDKSISHRALMIASLSPQISTIKNLSDGRDVQSTEYCLKL
ncbi:3-phosphoshikimate 1-carboxyvinyltransferase, partial [bacterium]|nr:3-phosphoshikimate 1-carboxyvinyltransferase [bacterium]